MTSALQCSVLSQLFGAVNSKRAARAARPVRAHHLGVVVDDYGPLEQLLCQVALVLGGQVDAPLDLRRRASRAHSVWSRLGHTGPGD